LIVLVDQDLACGDDDVSADVVLRYRRRPDASKVLEAAEEAIRRRRARRSSASHPGVRTTLVGLTRRGTPP
jgi:hypothetical protein